MSIKKYFVKVKFKSKKMPANSMSYPNIKMVIIHDKLTNDQIIKITQIEQS